MEQLNSSHMFDLECNFATVGDDSIADAFFALAMFL